MGVATSDADGDPLTYSWDFGDGDTSTQVAPTHVYQRGGVFMIRVAVRDRETVTNAEVPITVKTMDGAWDTPITPDHTADLVFTQVGSSITGYQIWPRYELDVLTSTINCPVSGTVMATAPHLTVTRAACDIAGLVWNLELSADANSITSTLGNITWLRR